VCTNIRHSGGGGSQQHIKWVNEPTKVSSRRAMKFNTGALLNECLGSPSYDLITSRVGRTENTDHLEATQVAKLSKQDNLL
jgi:hypothetical protein